jgi:hypothetical protein
MRAQLGLLVLTSLLSCVAACGSKGNPGFKDKGVTSDTDGDGNADDAPSPLAADISVSEVAVFQGVKVQVMKGGAKVAARKAPVVARRTGMVRVYVAPDEAFTPRQLTCELRLAVGGTVHAVLKDTKTISAASSDDKLASTFNFDIGGDNVPAGTEYSVAISEGTTGAGETTEESAARYPSDGSFEALDARESGDKLKVTLVPIRYDADGSKRLPDTSTAQVERYRKMFLRLYPAVDVEVTVRAPFGWANAIAPNGGGWEQVLQAVVNLRQTDRVAADIYYMGIFTPAASAQAFCGGGCVAGLSGRVTDARDAAGRASVGIGFTGDEAASTAAHEVGHAHGRAHSPCNNPSDVDPAYPYAKGSIGSWGNDILAKTLISPTTYTDIMGYCQKVWISDYTYGKLFDRIASVNKAARILGEWTPQAYRFVRVGSDGALTWGDRIVMNDRPTNEPQTVTYVGADGATLQTATGHYYPYDELPGGYMLVPEGPAKFEHLRVRLPAFSGTRELRRSF